MSLEQPTYIAALQTNIRARPISWEGAVRAKTISENDLKKIKAIDKVRKEQRKQILDAETQSYVDLFLGGKSEAGIFSAASKRPDIVQYMLVLADDVIDDSPAFVSALTAASDPYSPFLPLLKSTNQDDPVPLLAASVLTKILSKAVVLSKPSPKLEEAISTLFTYLAGLSKSTEAGLQDIAVQSFSAVLRTKKTRELFWDNKSETLDPLIEILRAGAGASKDASSTLWSEGASTRTNLESGISGGVGIQLIYHVLLVLWQLSFEGALVGDGLQDDYDILILYVQLLRVSPKEKITRLLISTLYNVLTTNKSTLLPAASLARLPTLLTSLANSRKVTDPDLVEDLNSLNELLDDYTKTQTTFDEYAAELQTGHLRWSPPHRNPTFWAENARRILDEDKGALPRKLAEIMAKPWDTDKEVLAIACNDVAALVKEVPEKRPFLEKLGLKTRVMELMQDPNEHVRWESLRAVGEWLRYSFDKK